MFDKVTEMERDIGILKQSDRPLVSINSDRPLVSVSPTVSNGGDHGDHDELLELKRMQQRLDAVERATATSTTTDVARRLEAQVQGAVKQLLDSSHRQQRALLGMPTENRWLGWRVNGGIGKQANNARAPTA